MGELLAILASIVTIIRGGREEIKELVKSRQKSEPKLSKPQLLESTNGKNFIEAQKIIKYFVERQSQ